MSGTIRDTFSRFTNLQVFDLSDNAFTGSIPTTLFELTNLQGVFLYLNRLYGSIPNNLGDAPALKDLELYGNRLTGTVPALLPGQFRNLTTLLLEENQLTGSISPSICQLRTSGKLLSLWTDCAPTASPRVICSFPDCCDECFPISTT